jgi:hypothetical protein
MRFEDFSFGSIRIDGVTYEHDVVIDGGSIYKRKKKPSKKFRDDFGHTPLLGDKFGVAAYDRLAQCRSKKECSELSDSAAVVRRLRRPAWEAGKNSDGFGGFRMSTKGEQNTNILAHFVN